MKLINIFKQTLKEGVHLQELSPLTRNLAAYSAASKIDNEKTSELEKTVRADQYKNFTELPSNLQSKGKALAEEIRNSLYKDSYGKITEYELKKYIPSAKIAKAQPPLIVFKVRILGDVRNNSGDLVKKQNLLEYVIYKDNFKESEDNPKLNRDLSNKLLTFFEDLQKELQ